MENPIKHMEHCVKNREADKREMKDHNREVEALIREAEDRNRETEALIRETEALIRALFFLRMPYFTGRRVKRGKNIASAVASCLAMTQFAPVIHTIKVLARNEAISLTKANPENQYHYQA